MILCCLEMECEMEYFCLREFLPQRFIGICKGAHALGKPLFKMCCFHMGIAHIVEDPSVPSSVKRAPWSTFFGSYFFTHFCEQSL